jgi:hypothetical protein
VLGTKNAKTIFTRTVILPVSPCSAIKQTHPPEENPPEFWRSEARFLVLRAWD